MIKQNSGLLGEVLLQEVVLTHPPAQKVAVMLPTTTNRFQEKNNMANASGGAEKWL